ncbi:metallophosphoesterase [Clostridium sp. BL-8]|uniref:metallophosphoesterase family protein n=1 Tax=Clostridium sp. BL-8 TaxID=349938 RepID=UPI00098C9002|nr:metallophosphoesterase [Clostridium sp. BL-8]OOM79967.1 3',5'-cyclic adenosine monophosphate phosphodiesterase CpdA [Clostridium sp. BL-8]
MNNDFKRQHLKVKAGTTIFASTGILGKNSPNRMSTEFFYKAFKGNKIILLNSDYYFNVATYSLNFDDKYIYTYCYQEEECWTTYNHDLSGDSYRQEDYIFTEEVYFRICLKRVDCKDFTDEEAQEINNILLFLSKDSTEGYKEKSYFSNELQKTVDTILEKRTKKSLVLCVLSDSHVTINGTWKYTIHNIKSINRKVSFNGIVHLGDLTDGMVSADVTRKYAQKIINDLREINVPLYIAIGNHDTNYFNGNLESFSEKEQYEIYQKHSEKYVNRDFQKLYYFSDFNDVSLRCIFLTSFDHNEKLRYGFPDEELIWLKKVLDTTPTGYSIIVFSHEAPLSILDYWTDEIRNGDKLMSILEEYHLCENRKIMAFIHGHTHADYIYTQKVFPIVSIGCSKCEYFTDKKPEGAITHKRKLNTVSQELWDTLIITPSENKIDFVRFGAGVDRTL